MRTQNFTFLITLRNLSYLFYGPGKNLPQPTILTPGSSTIPEWDIKEHHLFQSSPPSDSDFIKIHLGNTIHQFYLKATTDSDKCPDPIIPTKIKSDILNGTNVRGGTCFRKLLLRPSRTSNNFIPMLIQETYSSNLSIISNHLSQNWSILLTDFLSAALIYESTVKKTTLKRIHTCNEMLEYISSHIQMASSLSDSKQHSLILHHYTVSITGLLLIALFRDHSIQITDDFSNLF